MLYMCGRHLILERSKKILILFRKHRWTLQGIKREGDRLIQNWADSNRTTLTPNDTLVQVYCTKFLCLSVYYLKSVAISLPKSWVSLKSLNENLQRPTFYSIKKNSKLRQRPSALSETVKSSSRIVHSSLKKLQTILEPTSIRRRRVASTTIHSWNPTVHMCVNNISASSRPSESSTFSCNQQTPVKKSATTKPKNKMVKCFLKLFDHIAL